jgi:feruloyl esterase
MLGIALAVAAAGANCGALAGAEGGAVVVQRATLISPAPAWQPDGGRSSYMPVPVTAPLCRVEGTIEGNIGFELWLPVQWNGRLLGAGVGGDAGIFNYRDMSLRVKQGFATVTTDSGHKATDPRWMARPKARVDYEHRAVHLTALAAKKLARRFYARPVDRSYFLGCSGGGRQALKEMQNYPADYDGVVAGAPGPNMPLISVRMMWQALAQKHDPAGALTDSDWALYEKAAIAGCDRNDGVADGIVENPLTCRVDTAKLLCRDGGASACLTAPKLAMLDRIRAPMPDEAGRAMDKGLLPGVRTRPGPPSPLLRAMWGDAVYDDPNWDEESFRRSADLAAVNRVMPELRADRTDIGDFLRRGGKAIIYQGWADPSVIAGPTVDYYAALARANGGVDRLDDSVRLFMVPGMYHCRGGVSADAFGGSGQPVPDGAPRPDQDILWTLIRWVEGKAVPERLTATRFDETGKLAFTRTLCPFPRAAAYDGRGETADARSWRCRPDASLAARLNDR